MTTADVAMVGAGVAGATVAAAMLGANLLWVIPAAVTIGVGVVLTQRIRHHH